MYVIKKTKQFGFTLVELMIGLALSTIIMLGLLGMCFSILKHSSMTLDVGRLDRYLHSTMAVMANDIRRAGYWGLASTSTNNPFMTNSSDITVNAGGNCILLTYDHDNDGMLPAITSVTDDERYGYRLIGNVIQYRPYGALFDCNATSSEWDNLTDPNIINITAFSLIKNDNVIDIDGAGPGTSTLTLRTITIVITGQLTSDSSISKTITQTVKVYNDKYSP